MILAIDPGTTESAYCLYDLETKGILEFKKIPNAEMLYLVEKKQGLSVVIEMVASYGMPVGREVFETVLFIGRLVQATRGEARLIYRKDVKIHLCHSMKANDAAIRQALIDKFGKPGTKKEPGKTYGMSGDCWSALAVAVTAAESTC